jgi:cyclopropane fatty-acyl-phospholipid synthase-like methyltransferase
MKQSSNSYIPALGYRWLTRFYDPVVRVTTREATFKEALLRQASIQDEDRILNLGCGTGTLALLVKHAYRGAEVFGLDADPDALKLASTKLAESGIEVRSIMAWHRPCRIRRNRSAGPFQVCFFITCLPS